MSLPTPALFTGHHTEEIRALASMQEEALKKLALNMNYLNDLVPIGKILIWQENQIGVGLLSQDVYQRCDGTEITHPLSPLRTIGVFARFTPNMTEKYLRFSSSKTSNGTGGSQEFDFTHDHGAETGPDTPSGPLALEEDGDRRIRVEHTHSIEENLGEVVIDFPAYYGVGAFMKIL